MTAGAFAGIMISALCHIAGKSDAMEKREKTSKVSEDGLELTPCMKKGWSGTVLEIVPKQSRKKEAL